MLSIAMADKELIVSPEECLEMLKLYRQYNNLKLAHKAYMKSNLYISLNVFKRIVHSLTDVVVNENFKNDVNTPIEVVDLTDDADEELEVISKQGTSKEEANLNTLDKLLQIPIVYTTKLDDMPLFKHKNFLKYSQKLNVIYSITSHSTPQLDEDNFNPQNSVTNIEKYLNLVQRLDLVFDRTNSDENDDDQNSKDCNENSRNCVQCKPMSIVLEDFMKSPKLLADIRREGITFDKECVNTEQPITTFNKESSNSQQPKHSPASRQFISYRNRYWLICDKTSKETLWDLYYINSAGDVNFLILNQNQQKKDDVLTPMFKSQRIISTEICCWYKRKVFIHSMENNKAISSDAAVIMSKKHSCVDCNCCCSTTKERDEQSKADEPVVTSTKQTNASPDESCTTPYKEIIKTLAEVTNGCSLIKSALKFDISRIKLTRQNMKLDKDIKTFRYQNESTIPFPILFEKLNSQPILKEPIPEQPKPDLPIPEKPKLHVPKPEKPKPKSKKSKTKQRVTKRDCVTDKSVNTTTKSTSYGPPNYINIRSKLPETPNLVPEIQPIVMSSDEPPPLQPIIHALKAAPNSMEPVKVTVSPNNATQPTPSPEAVNTIVKTILETFKNVRLNIDENAKIAAVLPKPVEHLTTAELKILRHVLNLAEKQVKELKVNPSAKLTTNINFLNKSMFSMSAVGNKDGSLSLAFSASVDKPVQSEPVKQETVQTFDVDAGLAPSLPQSSVEDPILPDLEEQLILPKIENVFSLQEAFQCIKNDLTENQNNSECDKISPLFEDNALNDYDASGEIEETTVADVKEEMSSTEKAYERKRKYPITNELTKTRIVSQAFQGAKQDLSENKNNSESDIICPLFEDNTLNDYEGEIEKTFVDNVKEQLCNTEKANERKRKSPIINNFPKIRIVSPSKLGIPKEVPNTEPEVPSTVPVAGPSIMVVPPATLQQYFMHEFHTSTRAPNPNMLNLNAQQPNMLNLNFQQPNALLIPAAPSTATPIILNHQIDNTVRPGKPIRLVSKRNTSVVSIDQKGKIMKWWKG